MTSLRDRKRERTRRALVEAATELFETRGYDETTVADIAAAAEIGTRTFFSYFASKEEVLFPEADARIAAAVEAVATRTPGETPAEVLVRTLTDLGPAADEMLGRTAALRLRLTATVPAVRGRGLQLQLDAQREIARHLRDAFPDQLDEVSAGALVGAFIGAVTGALQAILDRPGALDGDPAAMREDLKAATKVALRPWTQAE
ncbi:helix-turn-helix domain-containing protein [Phytomonospora sp. NPDC050363]|uniref:TetR/AcrR family transcriptional regulator n=1 Tax=Phytomonospora sp. NPDC050363 TaxID=3155642 RepID=UPI003402D327